MMFATRATYHMTTQTTLAQLVFGRDAILNTKLDANWRIICDQKQRAINQNNQKEDSKRISHTYKLGNVVLYRNDYITKFSQDPYDGPYNIVQVNTNGTVRLQMGAVTDTVNICLLKPHKV